MFRLFPNIFAKSRVWNSQLRCLKGVVGEQANAAMEQEMLQDQLDRAWKDNQALQGRLEAALGLTSALKSACKSVRPGLISTGVRCSGLLSWPHSERGLQKGDTCGQELWPEAAVCSSQCLKGQMSSVELRSSCVGHRFCHAYAFTFRAFNQKPSLLGIQAASGRQ